MNTKKMTLSTVDELTEQVAISREPKPMTREVGQYFTEEWSWQRYQNFEGWQPFHGYADFPNATAFLKQEMVEAGASSLSVAYSQKMKAWTAEVQFLVVPLGIDEEEAHSSVKRSAETEEIAICLLYLAWRRSKGDGVPEVEWAPKKES